MKAGLLIESDPEIMSGVPVFTGTRVPVESLFDYLMKGSTLDEFLDCFPTIKREDALLILDHFPRSQTPFGNGIVSATSLPLFVSFEN